MKTGSEVFVFGKDVAAVDAGKGIKRKVLGYNENVMVCEIRLEKGAVVHMHQHPHEQCTNLISGRCTCTVGDETKEINAGDSVMMGGYVPHEVIALEECLIIDVFAPMREDFV